MHQLSHHGVLAHHRIALKSVRYIIAYFGIRRAGSFDVHRQTRNGVRNKTDSGKYGRETQRPFSAEVLAEYESTAIPVLTGQRVRRGINLCSLRIPASSKEYISKCHNLNAYIFLV